MASWTRSPARWGTALWLSAVAEGVAQPRPAEDEPIGAQALGGDIFGFTTPSDVGNPGERGIAFDLTSGLGKRGGLFWSSALSTELSRTVARNLSITVSSFAAGHRIRSVPELDDRSQVRFDAVSTEISYRFLERSRTNPLAATISVEPRVARVEADTGNRVNAYSGEFKLLTDAVLIPNRLYGAMNLKYYVSTQRGPIHSLIGRVLHLPPSVAPAGPVAARRPLRDDALQAHGAGVTRIKGGSKTCGLGG
jgi:hypothetical protein